MKDFLRKKHLHKRNAMPTHSINKKSNIIFKELKKSKVFKKSETIMFYVSFGSEVNTQFMIKHLLKNNTFYKNNSIKNKKIICVPIVKKNTLIPSIINKFGELNKKNQFGILEPSKIKRINKNKIDLVIVPGIVFDRRGHRIGYGKGYYDRFLRNYNGFKIGICFNFQIVKAIPYHLNDVKVDVIIRD